MKSRILLAIGGKVISGISDDDVFLDTDVDECVTGEHSCQSTRVCNNLPGSFSCSCPRGYHTRHASQPCLGQYVHTTLHVIGSIHVNQQFILACC